VEKVESSYFSSGNENLLSHWRKCLDSYVKISKDSPDDLRIPLLVVYPREMKTYVHAKICVHMFTATLFLTGQTGNSSRVHYLVSKETICGIFTEWLVSTNKNSEQLTNPKTQMKLRNMQSERNQTDTTFCLHELSRKGIFIETENRSVILGDQGRNGSLGVIRMF
jgi:hypothetical protein